ncbi:MAG: Smr/MutS family protein [Paracoccaceae bacterium]
MSRRKPRNLSPEERDLWSKVADSAKPLGPARKRVSDPAEILNTKPAPKKVASIPRFEIGQSQKTKPMAHDLSPSLTERLNAGPVQMDAKSFAKMKRGKIDPEGRIDLHGMTLSEAHPALLGFILNSHAAGKRLVLVITGKGKSKPGDGPIPARIGVLKHQVPQWLQQQPLKSVVLQVSQANLKHGGAGAYYVYLRRMR